MGKISIDKCLTGKRVVLRSRKIDDNAFVFEASQYPGFTDGMAWDAPMTIEEIMPRYYMALEDWIKGDAYSFVIQDNDSLERIGMISIRKKDEDGNWNIGYWTHPERQGKGYMTESVILILEYGFKILGAITIDAQYATWNIASERVLNKAGFIFVERIEEGLLKDGKWIPENRMLIGREELN